MSWLGWLLALFIAYGFLSDLFRSKRCYPHGVFGRCRRCEEEAAARVKAKAEAKAEAERQRMEIEETYKNMDEAKRDELTILVKERAKREPRWSLQNRPCVDVSKPAMESGLRQVLFYPAEVGFARQDSISVTC